MLQFTVDVVGLTRELEKVPARGRLIGAGNSSP